MERPFRVRARSDSQRRVTHAHEHGPRRYWGNPFSGIKRVIGNVGTAIKKGVVDTGHAIGSVASNPWAKAAVAGGLALTGVGAPAAAGILGTMGAAGGALKPGGGLRPAVIGGATGAAGGYVAGKLGKTGLLDPVRRVIGMGGKPSGGGIADASDPGPFTDDEWNQYGGRPGPTTLGGHGGITDASSPTTDADWEAVGGRPDRGAMEDFVRGGGTLSSGAKGAAALAELSQRYGPSLLDGVKRKIGSVIGGRGDDTGGMSALDIALAGLATQQGVASANASARSSGLSDKSLALAEQNWGAGAPLRAAGQSGLLNRTRPNLSSTFADPTNPLAGARRKLPVSRKY